MSDTTTTETTTVKTTAATLLVRKDTKQAWSGAAKQIMKDSKESLTKWVEGMNESLGWKKYGVAE